MRHYHCPVNGWDCPYYINSKILCGKEERGLCGMGFEGLNPYKECEDFYWAWAECDEEDYTDNTDDNEDDCANMKEDIMTGYDLIIDSQNTLVKYWGEKGKDVIVECAKVNPFNADFKHFLTYCTACGGNWGGMILSGIRELYPNVWEAIPDKMGAHAFDCICCTIALCGVDLD